MIDLMLQDLIELEKEKEIICCEKCRQNVCVKNTVKFYDSKEMVNKIFCNKCFANICDFFMESDIEGTRLDI